MQPARRAAVCALAAIGLPVRAQLQPPLRVVASFSILADLLREVGGRSVEVAALVGPDADAHVYEPRPGDAMLLAQADWVVVNGLGFEGWIDRLVRASGYRGEVQVASLGVPARQLAGAPDPHAWQALPNAQRYVQILQDGLLRLRPADAVMLRERAARYSARLAALDAEVRGALATVPAGRRRVLTSHEAFGYFGAAYGVEFIAAQGRSTGSEASAADVARLIDQIRSHRVAAVFVENISDPRLVERIAREGGVAVGGRLYSDALSPPGTEADTYLRLFAHNADAISSALKASLIR